MKLRAFARDTRGMLASPNGRWLPLFSLGIGLSLLWTYVPLFLAPLGVGLGASLFDTPSKTVAYFAACAALFAAHPLLRGTGASGAQRVGARAARTAGATVAGTAGTQTAGSAGPVSAPSPAGTRRDASAPHFGLARYGMAQVAAGVTGGVLLTASTLMPDASASALTLGCAGAALAAFSNVSAVLNASRLLKRLSPARAIVACTGAFVVAAALTTLAAFVSGPLACALMALVPVATWALSRMSDARVPFADLSAAGERSLTLVPLRMRDAWRYGAITLGLFVMGGWLLANAGQYHHLPQELPAWVVGLQSVAVLVLFALAAALVQAQPRPLGYDLICRVCVPAIAMGIVLTFIPENNAGYLDDAAVCLTFMAMLLCDLMVWVIDVCAARSDMRAFAVMRAMTCVGVIASTLVTSVKWAPLDKPKVILIITLCMLIVTIVCLPAADVKVLTATEGAPRPLRDLPAETRERLSGQIVAHGLTAREAEVFSLMMDDLDAAGIAARLGVSGATVHTHVQHVYAKFGVHSRKELERAVRAKG